MGSCFLKLFQRVTGLAVWYERLLTGSAKTERPALAAGMSLLYQLYFILARLPSTFAVKERRQPRDNG